MQQMELHLVELQLDLQRILYTHQSLVRLETVSLRLQDLAQISLFPTGLVLVLYKLRVETDTTSVSYKLQLEDYLRSVDLQRQQSSITTSPLEIFTALSIMEHLLQLQLRQTTISL